MAQCCLQKPKQYLHPNLVSSTAYTSVFWSSLTLLPRSCMCMCRCNFKPITIGHTHHSRPTAAALFELSSVYVCDSNVLAPLELQYYLTFETSITENSLPRLSLCERLSGLWPVSVRRISITTIPPSCCDHRYYYPCTGIGNGVLGARCTVAVQFSVKHPYTDCCRTP